MRSHGWYTLCHGLSLKCSSKFPIDTRLPCHSTTQKFKTISQELNSGRIHFFYNSVVHRLHGKMEGDFYSEGALGELIEVIFDIRGSMVFLCIGDS